MHRLLNRKFKDYLGKELRHIVVLSKFRPYLLHENSRHAHAVLLAMYLVECWGRCAEELVFDSSGNGPVVRSSCQGQQENISVGSAEMVERIAGSFKAEGRLLSDKPCRYGLDVKIGVETLALNFEETSPRLAFCRWNNQLIVDRVRQHGLNSIGRMGQVADAEYERHANDKIVTHLVVAVARLVLNSPWIDY